MYDFDVGLKGFLCLRASELNQMQTEIAAKKVRVY